MSSYQGVQLEPYIFIYEGHIPVFKSQDDFSSY